MKKTDLPMWSFRWLTVTASAGAEGSELVLEPLTLPPAATYQQVLFAASRRS